MGFLWFSQSEPEGLSNGVPRCPKVTQEDYRVSPRPPQGAPFGMFLGKSWFSCRCRASFSKKRCKGVQKSTSRPRVTPSILSTVWHFAMKKLEKTVFGFHVDPQIWTPFDTWTFKNHENQWKSMKIPTTQTKIRAFFGNPSQSLKV